MLSGEIALKNNHYYYFINEHFEFVCDERKGDNSSNYQIVKLNEITTKVTIKPI